MAQFFKIIKMKHWINILLLILLCSGKLFAQTDAEQQVRTYLDRIQYWRYEYSPEDSGVNPNANTQDSLLTANKQLQTFLLSGNTSSIQPSESLENVGLRIVSSDDKTLRIYSWNTETGDEKHKYQSVLEYKTAAGTKTIPGTDDNEYTKIYTVGNGRKYYLAMYSNILSVKDALKGVKVFAINNTIEDADILRTPSGLSNKTEYTYDYSANFSFKKMKEENVIHMEKQKLYIPEVKEDKTTGNWLVYIFDGKEFVLDKK